MLMQQALMHGHSYQHSLPGAYPALLGLPPPGDGNSNSNNNNSNNNNKYYLYYYHYLRGEGFPRCWVGDVPRHIAFWTLRSVLVKVPFDKVELPTIETKK